MTLNDIRGLSNSNIYSFIYFLSTRQYKNNTRIKKIEHLKTFFNYLYTISHKIFKQPFKIIKAERKIEKKLPNYLSLEEAIKVRDAFKHCYKLSDIRNHAIINLLLNCGLRLSEITNLNISDLNLLEDKFTVIGKGNKERTCYLNKLAKSTLNEYLKYRDKFSIKNKKDKDALFLSNKKERLSKSQIQLIVKLAYKRVNIDSKKYDTHTLRHTCATLLYKNGINIRTIQELLGHAQINTTEIYTHLYDKEVHDAMVQHPMNKYYQVLQNK